MMSEISDVVNVDLADGRVVMEDAGTALVGVGIGVGRPPVRLRCSKFVSIVGLSSHTWNSLA